MPVELADAARSVDEAFLLYRGSASGWENASDYIHVTPSAHQRGTGTREVSSTGVKLRAVLPLPPAFNAQNHNARYSSFMGLLPQISRAWLSVDSNLFLWAYSPPDASARPFHQDDLYVYEGISQVIVSVALVQPREGHFVKSVQFLLAIATSVDVTLLAVSFSATGEISLFPTNISVATDGVLMLKLQSTPDGRIFMAGSDGALHEFVYDTRPQTGIMDFISGRRPKRARKVIHTPTPFASYLVPKPVKAIFSKDSELVDLSIDPSRGALYTLDQAGQLAVYDIHDQSPARWVTSVNITHESRNRLSFSVPAEEREYVSIHPVDMRSSSYVHMIVITTLGERIYFSTSADTVSASAHPVRDLSQPQGQDLVRPKTLTCVGYRESPDRISSRSSRPCVHIAWCDNGAAIFADLRENSSDRLICVYPDASLNSLSRPHTQRRPGTSLTTESVVEVTLGDADGIERARNFRNTPLTAITPGTGNGMFDNSAGSRPTLMRTFAIVGEKIGQSIQVEEEDAPLESPDFFWVLSSTALHFFERVKPIEILREILRSGATSEIQDFFSRHGAAEACCMCLEIGVTTPPMLTTAANVFYTYGAGQQFDGRQHHSEQRSDFENRRVPLTLFSSGGGGRGNSPYDIGRPSLQLAAVSCFSGAHDGTSLFLAKTLYPLWNRYITSNRDPHGYQNLAASKDVLGSVRDQVLAIVSFLDRFSPETMLPDNNEGSGGDVPESSRVAESSSISGLKNLAVRTAEALALLMILGDHQLHRLVTSIPDGIRTELAKMRLCEFVVSDKGSIVSSSLIEALFSSYADGGSPVDHFARVLQEKCPTFFGDSDVDLHRALGLLRKAVAEMSNFGMRSDDEMHSPHVDHGHLEDKVLRNSQNMVEEAAMLLKTVPNRVNDIHGLCEYFITARALPSLVDVVLVIGKEAEAEGKQDRANAAYDEVFRALRPVVHGDDRRADASQDAVVPVQIEYAASSREAAIRVALGAESETFLEKLYEYLLDSKYGQEILMAHPSPRLEKFLEDKGALELLWKYCAQHGRHLEAAGVLLILAESGEDVSLVNRLNHLSCALHNAKTAASMGDTRAPSLVNEISIFMDVAKVQLRVREELSRCHGGEESALEALKKLDGPILDLSTLFNKYSRPFKLLEASLEALRCSEYRDEAYVGSLWFEIVEREGTIAKTPAAMQQRFLSLAREFYPSDVVFPTGYIIDILERMIFKNKPAVMWRDVVDWVPRTMKALGVPLSDIVDGYRRLVENPQNTVKEELPWSWAEENAQLHLLKATEKAVNMWAAERFSTMADRNAGYDQSRRYFLSECDQALKAITLCKSRLRGMNTRSCSALAHQFEALERKVARLSQ